MFAEVIVDVQSSNVDKIFDYELETALPVGTRVLVPFGNRQIEGYIINLKQTSTLEKDKIKKVICPVDDRALISEELILLMHFMKQKYNLKYIDVLRLFLPSELRDGRVKPLVQTLVSLNPEINLEEYTQTLRKNAKNLFGIIAFFKENNVANKTELSKQFSLQSVNKLFEDNVLLFKQEEILRTPFVVEKQQKNIVWNKEQERAIGEICKFENKTYVLHGVTGSGKTEVYMGAISSALKQGKTAIMLVPEISLTPQVLASLKSRFGDDVAILHSGLSQGERFDEWRRISLGQARVVVGARSAIFAPINNLGIVIIDEEHDGSYFSESNPRFFTHTIAQFRTQFNKCPLVLGSATPSVETYYKTTAGEFTLLSLPTRANKRPMPKIQVVDMLSQLKFGNSGIFSSYLIEELKKVVNEEKQAMLFLNRRGFTSFMMCRECGYVAKCTDCDVSLVYHKDENRLKCHYCNKKFKALTACPECHSTSIKQGAIGTQKVVDELKKLFPDVKILRMDNDTTGTKNAHQKILSEFGQTHPAFLVGTQMIAKGHDFKDVTFVGIVDADQSLYHSDYKAAEKTFALITQMSGRAGREESEGKAILQTYAPKHYVYRFASNYDFEGFFKKEINLRQVTHFPPFSIIIRVLFSGEQDEIVKESLKNVYTDVLNLKQENKQSFYYLDAMKSPISRMQKKFRYQILMRFETAKEDEITQKLYEIVNKHKNGKVSVFVEVNPQSLS